MKDFYNINLALVVVFIWGFISWFLLVRLYVKFRDLQQRLGHIPYDNDKKKADKYFEGFLEISIVIFQEKFAELKRKYNI